MYLKLPQTGVQGRNNGKFPPGSSYTDRCGRRAVERG
jgi:hypothetical protein